MEAPNKWVKGQRCPKCGGQRGKVIAHNVVTRASKYGTYRYHRFTHRVELRETRVIESGPRKGFQYYAKKRKYCYLPIGAALAASSRPADPVPAGRRRPGRSSSN